MSWERELQEHVDSVVEMTHGMKNHYRRLVNDNTHHRCEDCDGPVGKYPGRYPRYCPHCGADYHQQKSYKGYKKPIETPTDKKAIHDGVTADVARTPTSTGVSLAGAPTAGSAAIESEVDKETYKDLTKLFVYGELADPKTRKKVFGREVSAEAYSLKGYELVNRLSKQSAFPTIQVVPEKNAQVDGFLLSLASADLKKAEEYENRRYHLVPVQAGEEHAHAFMVPTDVVDVKEAASDTEWPGQTPKYAKPEVLDMYDTRERDWDTGKPIPGTGRGDSCQRCTRIHDVVWVVRDVYGKTWQVGTSCGKKLWQGAEPPAAEFAKVKSDAERKAKAAFAAKKNERIQAGAQEVKRHLLALRWPGFTWSMGDYFNRKNVLIGVAKDGVGGKHPVDLHNPKEPPTPKDIHDVGYSVMLTWLHYKAEELMPTLFPNLKGKDTYGSVYSHIVTAGRNISIDEFSARNLKESWETEFSQDLAEKLVPLPVDDCDPLELEAGIAVELEHTDDRAEASGIARQHLREDPHYYRKLFKAEIVKKDEVGDAVWKKMKDTWTEATLSEGESYWITYKGEKLHLSTHHMDAIRDPSIAAKLGYSSQDSADLKELLRTGVGGQAALSKIHQKAYTLGNIRVGVYPTELAINAPLTGKNIEAVKKAFPLQGGISRVTWDDTQKPSFQFIRVSPAVFYSSFSPDDLRTTQAESGNAVCAWCGKDLGDRPGLKDGEVSHGMCQDCYTKVVGQIKKGPVKESLSEFAQDLHSCRASDLVHGDLLAGFDDEKGYHHPKPFQVWKVSRSGDKVVISDYQGKKYTLPAELMLHSVSTGPDHKVTESAEPVMSNFWMVDDELVPLGQGRHQDVADHPGLASKMGVSEPERYKNMSAEPALKELVSDRNLRIACKEQVVGVQGPLSDTTLRRVQTALAPVCKERTKMVFWYTGTRTGTYDSGFWSAGSVGDLQSVSLPLGESQMSDVAILVQRLADVFFPESMCPEGRANFFANCAEMMGSTAGPDGAPPPGDKEPTGTAASRYTALAKKEAEEEDPEENATVDTQAVTPPSTPATGNPQGSGFSPNVETTEGFFGSSKVECPNCGQKVPKDDMRGKVCRKCSNEQNRPADIPASDREGSKGQKSESVVVEFMLKLPSDADWFSPDGAFSKIWLKSRAGVVFFWHRQGRWIRQDFGPAETVPGTQISASHPKVREIIQRYFALEESWEGEFVSDLWEAEAVRADNPTYQGVPIGAKDKEPDEVDEDRETVDGQDGSRAFKAAVAIIIREKSEVLLGLALTTDDRNGLWCFPGGGVDPEDGGDPLAAARREAYEETSLDVRPTGTVLVHPDASEVAFVVCEYVSGNPTPNKEFAELQWVPYNSVESFPGVYPRNRSVLQQVPNGQLGDRA